MRTLLALAAAALVAQPAMTDDTPAPSRTVVAGPRYRAGGLQRFFLGDGYRSTWTAPVAVPQFDLGAFGGLKPTRTGMGRQTISLHLVAPDGRRFRFRAVDKDTTLVVPKDLRDTVAEWVIQDQIASTYPVAPLVTDGLVQAAGLFYTPHTLYVMPDDPRLGEFRARFANMVGIFEETARVKGPVTPGFEGVTEILDTEELFARLDASGGERVDTRAFVKARLLDFVSGDWDRHQGQWRWVRREGHAGWLPFAVDRDMAFSDYDGLFPAMARNAVPTVVTFDPGHRGVLGLAWNSREVDRRLLAAVERAVYLEVAAQLRKELTDAALEAAVRRLPDEYYRLEGAALAAALRQRRDRLPDSARRFYELLARDVEVHGTDAADEVKVDRVERGDSVEVAITTPGAPGPYFRRRFRQGETHEVRLFLKKGDDRVVSQGSGASGVLVRVMGGAGDDTVDAKGGGTRVYDSEGDNRVSGSALDARPYEHPIDPRGFRRLDWGSFTFFVPALSVGGELGAVFGGQVDLVHYGFRQHPWASRQRVSAVYATARKGARLEYDGIFRHENSARAHRLFARASEIEIVRFYGFGNETAAPADKSFYRSDQRQYLFQPSLRLGPRAVDVWVGPRLKYQKTDADPATLLGQQRPYGVGDFGQVGANVTVAADTRSRPDPLGTGLRVSAEANYYPQVWSAEEDFGEVHGEVATYLRFLHVRAGGKKVWGRAPFHEAAFLGGPGTLRGSSRQRYAGQGLLFGNAELRVPLFRAHVLVPVRGGVFGLADAGRVWVEGEESDRWHTGLGGGLWFSFLKPENTLTIAAAFDPDAPSDERTTRIYLQAGFGF
jgi:hypothetical protein